MPRAASPFRPRPLPPRPLEPVPDPPLPLADRFRAEVRRHPGRLAAACLFTVAGPLLVLGSASAAPPPAAAIAARPPSPPPASEVPATPPPPVLALGPHVAPWMATASDAAATCPGLPAEVLVAIAHVETRLSDGALTSPAGALGPMQFLPATWAAYGVDGNGDGRVDVMDRVDAMHGAARLLCANGGSDPGRLPAAVWHYNRSPFYVDEVLRLAGVAG